MTEFKDHYLRLIDRAVEEARGMLERGENVVADWTGTDEELLVELRRRLTVDLLSEDKLEGN